MPDTSERIRVVFAKELNLDTGIINNESTLSGLGVDSLDAIGLIMAVEMEFGRNLPMDSFRSLEPEGEELTFGAFSKAVKAAYAQAC